MTEPQVSILLPVRNEAQHLPAALASLTRQTFSDWELIAVDDGSNDATATILKSAADKDPRIKLFQRPAEGLVAALNFGLQQCRAQLIARMDGDDICHPERLERQHAAMQLDSSLEVLSCRVRHFPRPQLQGGMRAYEEWQNELIEHQQICRDLYVESPFAHPSVMYRKQTIFQIGCYREREWAEDYDLWFRLAETGTKFARLPQILFYWRDRPERLTRTADNCSPNAFRAAKIHFLRRNQLTDMSHVWIWGAGIEGKRWMRDLAEVGITVSRWIDVDKKKIGRQIQQALVISHLEIPQKHPIILICVGTKGVRRQIRDYCDATGMIEGINYICVS